MTAEPTGQSYATELLQLERSMRDSASAARVGRQLPEWKNKVRLASDRVILQVVEAEVAGLVGDPSACTLWRRIAREDVVNELKHAYSESIKYCEGT